MFFLDELMARYHATGEWKEYPPVPPQFVDSTALESGPARVHRAAACAYAPCDNAAYGHVASALAPATEALRQRDRLATCLHKR